MSSERFAAGLKRWMSSAATRSPVPHRPAMRSMVFTALGAVGVVLGFVAVQTVAHTSPGSSASPPPPPSTTTTAPPAARPAHQAPAAVPTTTPPTTTPPAAAAAATPTSLEACTPSDVTVTTTTDYGSYPANTYVTVTTVVRDVFPCSFVPESGSGGSCPSAISVVDGSGGQVWPAPGQGEQCSWPATRTLSPRDVESLRAEWNQQVLTTSGGFTQAPAGSYVARGTWSWAVAGGSPYQVQVDSAPFTIG